MADVRYDRQVRLWGEEGQSSIEATTVCVLGSSSLATEILKSLVLSGIRAFCIVDDAIVTRPDLGNNFFLEKDDIGKPRADAALRLLQELNPRVQGSRFLSSPCSADPSFLETISSFSVVVATNMNESKAIPISAYLYSHGVPFVNTRVYGFIGYIRICVLEHHIANTHQENPFPNLRLDRPFEGLRRLVDSIDITAMTDEEVKHTPYVLLYLIALKLFRKAADNDTAFPESYAARKQFLTFVMSLKRENDKDHLDENFEQAKNALSRSVLRTQIPPDVSALLSDAKCQESSSNVLPFWIICTALRRFVEKHGVLPLPGNLPDMASDSKSYTRLLGVYHEKAVEDANEVYESTREIEAARSGTAHISYDMCARFCKNASFIGLQRGSTLESQRDAFQSVLEDIANEEGDSARDGEASLAVWFLLLRAADRFDDEKSRCPGTNGVPCEIDSRDVRERVNSIVQNTKPELLPRVKSRVSPGAVAELCRYGAAEPHAVAALVGGMAAQEVIKLATNQYRPLDNTLIFDAHTQTSRTFTL